MHLQKKLALPKKTRAGSASDSNAESVSEHTLKAACRVSLCNSLNKAGFYRRFVCAIPGIDIAHLKSCGPAP